MRWLQDRVEMEQKAVEALKTVGDELQGTYYPLADMDQDTQEQLVKDHHLFTNQDK